MAADIVKSRNSKMTGTNAPLSSNQDGRLLPAKRARIHACEFDGCFKCFDSKWALARHLRVHTGEKPFPCTYPNCGKSFAEKSAMTRHLQSHSTDKPYRCTYAGCNKSFKGKEYLGKGLFQTTDCRRNSDQHDIHPEFHLKMHAEGNPFACDHPNCNKTFKSPKSLKKHIRMWHNPGGKSTSIEQQLRERIIKMTNRNKEKLQVAETAIQTLEAENQKLKQELKSLKARFNIYDAEMHVRDDDAKNLNVAPA